MIAMVGAGLLLALAQAPGADASAAVPAKGETARPAGLASTKSMPQAPLLSDKGKGVKGGDMVCKVYPVTGTRFSKKYCRTAADWAYITEESKSQVDKWQKTDPTVPGT